MSPTTRAILTSWSLDFKVTLGIVAALLLYLRGWWVLHRTLSERFPTWRLWAFIGGLAAIWVAIASPLDAFSGLLLSAHMVQHLLLLSVAPLLLLLGAPSLPLLRGLPRKFARDGVGPFLVWPALRRGAQQLTHPMSCWIAMAITLCVWHLPPMFDLALRSPAWHKAEHAFFLGASLLFWWPVVRPFPSRPQWPAWSLPLYLLAADLLNTTISAIITFSDHVLYRPYLQAPHLFGTTALSDQSCAGLIMWVPGSMMFLIPAAWIAIQYLSPNHRLVRPPLPQSAALRRGLLSHFRRQMKPQFVLGAKPFDLLSVPLVGPFLRAQSGRRLLQAILLIIAIAVTVDGLFGPRVSSDNLAGVLPWTYWRALVVIGLLVAGNFFCMTCPFMLFREIGRRLGRPQRPWPRALRSKWLGVALLALFFWSYETFSLWDKPIRTAWVIIGYFIVAFAVDAVFRGASFCKYVCPIGQFQFVTSLISPLEVKVRKPAVCSSCRTHDCLRGNENHRGCELDLYLPRKSGNLDCTFCLDCVRACPHHNIGIMAVAPGMDIVEDPRRVSVGRFSERLDIAALGLVFVFAAFANAASMTAPVVGFEDYAARRLGFSSPLSISCVLLLLSLVVAPGTLAALCAYAGRAVRHVSATTRELLCRFSMSLIPLGAAMWAGHFLFHLNIGWNSGWTTTLQAASRWHLVGSTSRAIISSLAGAGIIRILQILLLDAGLLLSLYLLWRIALVYTPRVSDSFLLFAPWATVTIALYSIGVWIFLQPMQMRGLPVPIPIS